MTLTSAPLVGRADQLERIGLTLDAAGSGDPAFVLVLGEAGIGKTVFLRAAAWLAETRGMRVLQGTAIASGATIPYLPLIAPLRAAVAGAPRGSAGLAAVLAMLHGEPASHAGEPPGDVETAADPARAARVVESIYDVVTRIPTLLVVDDVHWADAATLTVLDYLAHRARDDRLAVLAAARNDEPQVLRANPVADGRRYLQLVLPRLSRQSVREQVAMLTGGELPAHEMDTLFARSDGNPLYVEELLAQARADRPTTIGNVPAPPSLASLVRNRVDALPTEARAVAEALAVLGEEAPASLVAAVAGLEPAAASAALIAAERGGVVARRAEGHALRHPLFGDVLAAEQAGSRSAAEMHRRAAEALEAAGATPAELARHWEAAGNAARTWSTSMAAASAAEAAGAFVEARRHLGRALDYWPPDGEPRGMALLRAGYAAWHGGDPDDALQLAQRAAQEGAPPADGWLAVAQFAWDSGQRDLGTEAFNRAAAQLTGDSPPSARSRALWGQGRARIGEGRPEEAYRLGMEAATVAAAAGDSKWASQGLVLAGMARAWNSDIGGIAELHRGLAEGLRSGDPEAIGHAYQFLVELLWMDGRLEEAARVGREGILACDRLGLARSHGTDTRGMTALALLDLGAWTAADTVLERADGRAKPALARGLLAARRGEWDAAERELAASANEPSIGGRGRLGGLTEIGLTEMAWLAGDTERATAELDAIPPQPGVWAIDMDARTALWNARLGRPVASVGHFDRLFAIAAGEEVTARASGTVDGWLRAAAAWEACGRQFDRLITVLGAAEAAYGARDRDAGRAALESVLDEATALGALPLVERAEAMARRARIRIARTEPRSRRVGELTGRELEVLQLLAEGRTNPQIAQELFLSPKTVGIHVSRVLEKLAAHTRGEAVAIARRRGLIP